MVGAPQEYSVLFWRITKPWNSRRPSWGSTTALHLPLLKESYISWNLFFQAVPVKEIPLPSSGKPALEGESSPWEQHQDRQRLPPVCSIPVQMLLSAPQHSLSALRAVINE